VPIEIDSARVQSMLSELHAVGAGPTGTFRGVYSAPWRQAQSRIKAWMEAAGLDVRVDAVGNVWGHLDGREPGPPIVAGSHFDTVPNGGKFDGQLGHVGAVVAVDALRRQLGQPRRSLAVLAACEEEGSRFHCNFWASRATTGAIRPDEPNELRDFEGALLADEMRACGLDPARVADAAVPELAAFVELHVEQGPVLERMTNELPPGSPRLVGAVTAITGTGRIHVTLTGQPDHSGTTPMAMRRDALLGAGEVAQAVHDEAVRVGHPAVMTVGWLEVSPNIPNVVPGQVRFTIDARHPDAAVHRRLLDAGARICREVAARRNLECQAEEMWTQPPVAMAPQLVGQVRTAIERCGHRPVEIVAGAGHDAQVLGRKWPAAMIFVVSQGGRSHCPDEYTTPEDCAAGVQVLAETLRSLAY
jgi:allantoate deiminase